MKEYAWVVFTLSGDDTPGFSRLPVAAPYGREFKNTSFYDTEEEAIHDCIGREQERIVKIRARIVILEARGAQLRAKL